MKKIIVLLLSITLYFSSTANEGMWLYTMIDKLNIETKGCKLSPDQIYSINHSSLKDAIVGLGLKNHPTFFFCSAEIVSSKGLVFTNHHCGIDIIQNHSNLLNNFIKDGFWAKKYDDELPNQELTASVLDHIVDLTDSIAPKLDTIGDLHKRFKTQDSLCASYEKKYKKKGFTTSVVPFFDNNAFYLFVYKTFLDVRLVGAPPESIGSFGGETDNWVWPRHTGDFSILRIYTDSSGAPAEFSPKNIPLQTTNHLKISLKGYNKGDIAMIMGFPGSTDRYMTSWAIDNKILSNMNRIVIRSTKQDILKKYMDSDPAIKIQYFTKFKQSSNYWKYSIGENNSIYKLNILSQRTQEEQNLLAWIAADSSRARRYKHLFTGIQEYIKTKNDCLPGFDYINEALIRGDEILGFAYNLNKFLQKITSSKESNKDSLKNAAYKYIDEYFKNYNQNLDHELLVAMITLYIKNVPPSQYPSFIKDIVMRKFKGNVTKYVNYVFNNTALTSLHEAKNIIKETNVKKFHKDEAYNAMMSSITLIRSYYKRLEAFDDALENDKRQYIRALKEYYPDSLFSPDANATPRFTFGYIQDYKPRDAVYYKHFTTLRGIIEKEDSSNNEFILPPKLAQLYESKDYGQYGQNDTMPVCFISNNDITGGNSGSGVLNANGELIGIAFDGNWEALSGDTVFEKQTQRTINVDIRYVLFIIDKFAGATNLIDELSITK